MVCLKKMFNGEIMFHVKGILKRLQVKCLVKIIFKVKTDKFFVHFYHLPNILLRGTIYRAPKRLCYNALKKNEFKAYISLKEYKLACFTNS